MFTGFFTLIVSLVLFANTYIVQGVINYDSIDKNYQVKVYVDEANNEVQFTSLTGKPFIALNRTFVPYRVLAERMGASVGWEGSAKKVTATNKEGTQNVELFIGNPTYKVNGVSSQMDFVEPFILSVESRTYVPARYLTEGLGYTIDYARAEDGSQVMYIVAFTQGQDATQRQEVLNTLSKGSTVVKPPVGQIVDQNKIVVNGGDYSIGGDFKGTVRGDKYTIYKSNTAFGKPSPLLRIEVRNFTGMQDNIKVTCTSHPELNTRTDSEGDLVNMTGPTDNYNLWGTGYSIQLQRGMVIQFEINNGDSVTVQL